MNIETSDDLRTYLRSKGHIASDEEPNMQPLAGGVSNRTVLVTRANGEAFVIKQALAKLRVAVDWFSSPERIHREALGLHWINQLVPQSTPSLLFEDHAHHLIAMKAIPQPHQNWKTLLLAGDLRPNHVDQFAQLLARIHISSDEQRAQLASTFADRTFFETLRLEPYYAFTAKQLDKSANFLQALISETRQRAQTLVHGDYSPKNILVYNGKLILLDHEVIHFGDPAFDLGFSLTHLLSKANHNIDTQPHIKQRFTTAAHQYWQTYTQTVDDIKKDKNAIDPYSIAEISSFSIRHTLACLLARVHGRSPLEYLSNAARIRQSNAALSLLADLPDSVPELIDRFAQLCQE